MSRYTLRRPCSAVVAAFVVVLSACDDEQREVSTASTASYQERPQIFAVNYPTAYFAEVLAADSAVISFPAPADIDPADWQPDIETILEYQRADLILLNGAGYARWVRRISLPQQRLIDTGAAYTKDLIAADTGPAHSHGPEGAHDHGELAFTTWLDLELAQQQARAVAKAMQRLMPANGSAIAERAARLNTELAEIDQALVRATAQLHDVPILFSHPVYQYLERRYGLNGRSVHWEPDAIPTSQQWQALADILSEHPARFMLWEDEPLPEIREYLGAMYVSVIVYRPLGNRPAQGEFLSVMRANVEAIINAMSQTGYQAPMG